jgi:drug/metabolite transporter (DMT)-like permease
VLFLLFASVAFATSSPIARFARPAHPLLLAFGRVALAAAVLILFDSGRIIAAVRALGIRQVGLIALAGSVLGAHFALFLWGLDRTSLPAAVSLVSLEPLSVVLCAWLMYGIRPARFEQLGVVVATAGALVMAQAAGTGEHRFFGDALVLGAVLLFGVYVNCARLWRDVLASRAYAALVYASAALALAVVVLTTPSARNDLPALSTHSLVAIAALGLVPTLFGHTMVQAAARWLSPSTVALVCPGETLGSLAIGWVLLGAAPVGTELTGAGMILGGTFLALLGSPRLPGAAWPARVERLTGPEGPLRPGR